MKKIFYLFLMLVVSVLLIGCSSPNSSVVPDSNDGAINGSNEGIVIETTRKIYKEVEK